MLFSKENYLIKSNSMGFYQDLGHLDGLGIAAVSAKLYENKNKYCGSWNFGPSVNETMRVKNIVKLFFKFLKSKKK